jgi:hypothetical protein
VIDGRPRGWLGGPTLSEPCLVTARMKSALVAHGPVIARVFPVQIN